MEPIQFIYTTELRVKITRDELVVLCAVCARHYDRAVCALILPGPDAVLNAATNQMRADESSVEVDFTYRQLDTLAKGLEMATSPEEVKLAIFVRKLLGALKREDRNVNMQRGEEYAKEWWEEELRGS